MCLILAQKTTFILEILPRIGKFKDHQVEPRNIYIYALYTVMIVDNGIIRLLPQQYFHWLVVNIPGTDVSEGNEVMDYITPFIAGRDDDPHPMLLLVYQQSGRVGDANKSITVGIGYYDYLWTRQKNSH